MLYTSHLQFVQKCRIRAIYTVQSTAVSLAILTIFVFLSCRWFVELSLVV